MLVFQPEEEGGGGAKIILEAGALENVNAIFGMHISPSLPFGEVFSRPCPIMAGSWSFEAVKVVMQPFLSTQSIQYLQLQM